MGRRLGQRGKETREYPIGEWQTERDIEGVMQIHRRTDQNRQAVDRTSSRHRVIASSFEKSCRDVSARNGSASSTAVSPSQGSARQSNISSEATWGVCPSLGLHLPVSFCHRVLCKTYFDMACLTLFLIQHMLDSHQ